MKIIYKKRGKGKTTQAIKNCLQTGAFLVCHTRAFAQLLRHSYPKLNVATHDDFISGLSLHGVKAVIIDDVDMLLHRLAKGTEIQEVTLSRDYTVAERRKLGI